MKQYCRYCANMVCGDANWCDWYERTFSTNQIKRPNKCQGFVFNEIDALGENPHPYKPREKKTVCSEQIAFTKGE